MSEHQKLKVALGAATAMAVAGLLFVQWRHINEPADKIDQATKEIIEYKCKIAPNDPECKK